MNDNWIPACGGTETPFTSRSGKRLLYMWNRATGQHAYYDMGADLFLTDSEAAEALGFEEPLKRIGSIDADPDRTHYFRLLDKHTETHD